VRVTRRPPSDVIARLLAPVREHGAVPRQGEPPRPQVASGTDYAEGISWKAMTSDRPGAGRRYLATKQIVAKITWDGSSP
jgi:hypothetical protein